MNTTDIAKACMDTQPSKVASDLISTIKEVENAIADSENKIKSIQGRGFFKSIFSSTSNDLIAISQSQNGINGLMLNLIQEIIVLNVMSYSYLAAVLTDFQKMVREGWKDNDGCLHKLSTNGEKFANTASDIFKKILDGSKATHQKIELNTAQIEELKAFLKQNSEIDEAQSKEIARLRNTLHENDTIDKHQASQIDMLASTLENKNILDNEQSKEITKLQNTLQENNVIDEQQTSQIDVLADIIENKNALDDEQSKHLERIYCLLKAQENINSTHSQKNSELWGALLRADEKGKSRDICINTLQELTRILQETDDRLKERCKNLTHAVIGLGCLVGLLIVGCALFARGLV